MAISKRATKMVRRGGARFTSCKSLLNKEDNYFLYKIHIQKWLRN